MHTRCPEWLFGAGNELYSVSGLQRLEVSASCWCKVKFEISMGIRPNSTCPSEDGYIVLWLCPSVWRCPFLHDNLKVFKDVIYQQIHRFPSFSCWVFSLWACLIYLRTSDFRVFHHMQVTSLSFTAIKFSFPIRPLRNPICFRIVTLIFKIRGHKGQIWFPEYNSKSFRPINLKLGTLTDTSLGLGKMHTHVGSAIMNFLVTECKKVKISQLAP